MKECDLMVLSEVNPMQNSDLDTDPYDAHAVYMTPV